MRSRVSGPAPLRVIIGGGIGAGKSSVAAVFGDLGFSVIAADEVGHEVLGSDAGVVAEIEAAWPRAVDDGVVHRPVLAAIVFSDPGALARLEAITHPRIAQRIEGALATAAGDVVVEVPLQHLGLDAAPGTVRVAVVADPRTRIARAIARGGDRGDLERRMALQASDADWRAWADVTIDNSGAWADTERRVRSLVEELRADG